jgi:hypothetical protein
VDRAGTDDHQQPMPQREINNPIQYK